MPLTLETHAIENTTAYTHYPSPTPLPADENAMCKRLAQTHDLSLSDWGPYSKEYPGISHIGNHLEGMRFDVAVFPGFFRRKTDVPNVKWELGYHPRNAATDLSCYVYRHELEWKDRVYTDITYARENEKHINISAQFINTSERQQSLVLHTIASIAYPSARLFARGVHPHQTVTLPKGCAWIDAVDYETLHIVNAKRYDGLTGSGMLRGEGRHDNFVNGNALMGFGSSEDDRVSYRVHLHARMPSATMLLRAKRKSDATTTITIACGDDIKGTLSFTQTDEWENLVLPLGALGAGTHIITLSSNTKAPIEIDGFALAPKERVADISFDRKKLNYTPEIKRVGKGVMLRYPEIDTWYGIAWDVDDPIIREFLAASIDTLMRDTVNNNVSKTIKGEGEGHFTNVYIPAIPLPANTEKTLFGIVCRGDAASVEKALRMDDATTIPSKLANARKRLYHFGATNEGEQYRSSQEIMAATTLTGTSKNRNLRSEERFFSCVFARKGTFHESY